MKNLPEGKELRVNFKFPNFYERKQMFKGELYKDVLPAFLS